MMSPWQVEQSRPPLGDGVDALPARLGQTTFFFLLPAFPNNNCIALHIFFFCNTTSFHNSGLYGQVSPLWFNQFASSNQKTVKSFSRFSFSIYCQEIALQSGSDAFDCSKASGIAILRS